MAGLRSNGPYRLASGHPGGPMRWEPNPVWTPAADPLRRKEFLVERIGQRLRSRLMEMCLVIKMQGDDHRQVAGQASNEAAVRGVAPPPGPSR